MEDWTDQKLALVNAGYLNTIFEQSTEDSVRRALQTSSGVDPYPGDEYDYEPRLIHQHSASIAQLLERVLAYRREARDLEILAVKVAMDQRLFDLVAPIDEELELARLGDPHQLQLAVKSQKEAASNFGEAEPLSAGFSALASGRIAELEVQQSSYEQLCKRIRDRHQGIRDYHDVYRSKHSAPGNAHNYSERANRVIRLMVQDLKETYAKARAVEIGIQSLWQRKFEVPRPEGLYFIDDMVDWSRDVVRFLEHRAELEVQFDLVVPLVQPWLYGGAAVYPSDEFAKAISNSSAVSPIALTFKLTKEHFCGLRVRALSVGLSYGNETDIVDQSGVDRNATRDTYGRLRTVVVAPKQEYDNSLSPRRPQFVLGSVGLFAGASATDTCTSNVVYYIDPVGEWNIIIFPFAVFKDGTRQLIKEGLDRTAPLADLKLHFRLTVLDSLHG